MTLEIQTLIDAGQPKQLGDELSVLDVSEQSGRSWPAHLHLEFSPRFSGSGDGSVKATRMIRAAHDGPLYVQRPFYPEGDRCAHIYLLHPPGGIVSGDVLDIQVKLNSDTEVLVTTPGAGRAYGARETHKEKRQSNRLSVAENAILEWFPMENIVYASAHLNATTQVDLEADAKFIGWEVNCLGLPASDQPFLNGNFLQRLEINVEGRPEFVDQMHIESIDSALFRSPAGMAGHTVSGTMVAGPFTEMTQLNELAETLQNDLGDEACLSVTSLNRFLVARYLGDSAFDARGLFTEVWRRVRPALTEREVCVPRIWHT